MAVAAETCVVWPFSAYCASFFLFIGQWPRGRRSLFSTRRTERRAQTQQQAPKDNARTLHVEGIPIRRGVSPVLQE